MRASRTLQKWTLSALTALLVAAPLGAAQDTPGVYVILDGSGSMWGQLGDGTHKIAAAREVLSRFSAGDYAGREMAFRVYGHRREGDCSDTELVVPFSAPDAAIPRMAAFAEKVNPKGKTPIARSLRAALEDFGDRPGEIILVSDGIETCADDPCALVREWSEKNVAVRVHVVGLGLEDRERAAMECISEAAGTDYHDAQSADQLAEGLARIQQVSNEPGDQAPPDWRALNIRATNEAGETMRVVGTAVPEGLEPVKVTSNGRNLLPIGDSRVTVGVRTWNGTIFRPVTTTATVAAEGESFLDVVVPEPPSVRAAFYDRGTKIRGSFVRGFQGDEEVLGFRAFDRAYIEPGTYEFRARPNADNELAVTETFAEGDHKEIVFELVQTVLAKIQMVAGGSGIRFRTNYELWQDGELAYKVHASNGVRALPGTYDLKLPLRLTPFVHEGLVLTTEEEQEIEVEVPVGHLTVIYQSADGSRAKDERVFVERLEGDRWLRDGVKVSGEPIPLVAGSYRLEGWSGRGTFDEVRFDMAVGEDKEIVLRDKGDG